MTSNTPMTDERQEKTEEIRLIVFDSDSNFWEKFEKRLAQIKIKLFLYNNWSNQSNYQIIRGKTIVLIGECSNQKDYYTTCRSVRRKNEEVPVIFIIRKNDPTNTETGKQLGVFDYIETPLGEDELLSKIYHTFYMKEMLNNKPQSSDKHLQTIKKCQFSFSL